MLYLIIIYFILINIATFVLFGIDKSAAKAGRNRIPNKVLLGFSAIGGAAGALLGMQLFRHKTQKWYYSWTVPIMLALQMAVIVFGISAGVAMTSTPRIIGTDAGEGISAACIEECKEAKADCILVLGCAVWENNQPSPMLKDRLDTGIELYRKGAAPKILLTGDNSRAEYSEPDCMLEYTLKQGVPAEDIFLDFAGFSTYDSIYRAGAIFKADSIIVVTQKYHLFRAMNIADALGIKALGVASNQQQYTGRYYRELREVLARDKDLVKGALKIKPKYLGDEIPMDGDGRATHLN